MNDVIPFSGAAAVALFAVLWWGLVPSDPEPSTEDKIAALQQQQIVLLQQKLDAIREQTRILKELCGQP